MSKADDKTPEFPVVMEKGTGDERVKRTVHSLIGFRQAETEGFTIGGSKKSSGGTRRQATGGRSTNDNKQAANK